MFALWFRFCFGLVFYKISLNWLQIYISVFKSIQSIHFFLIFVCLNEDSHWSGPNLNSLNKRQINWVAQGTHLATSTIHWQKKKIIQLKKWTEIKLDSGSVTSATHPQDNEGPFLKNWFLSNQIQRNYLWLTQ